MEALYEYGWSLVSDNLTDIEVEREMSHAKAHGYAMDDQRKGEAQGVLI